MINVNILNNLIKGISEQIPLVNSYYTQSPYDAWNVNEVKYGSVSFVVSKVNTRESTTAYDATIYYADRLVEDNSNRDSLFSDAATVIQTIVGALNTADDYLEVSYPVTITLFEQDFADRLAGGYAQVTISAEGMGECFTDEFSVPEIIATSAYFTKAEIAELFPLRTQLSTVAFSGSFYDLSDAPEVVTNIEYNRLVESVSEGLSNIASEVQQKVSTGYFDGWSDNVEKQLEDKVSKQQFDNLVEATKDTTANLAVQIESKLDIGQFDNWLKTTDIENRVTQQQFDNLVEATKDTTANLAVQIESKVDILKFDDWKDGIEERLNDCVDRQEYNNILNDIQSVQNQLDTVPSEQDFNNVLNDVEILYNQLDDCVDRQEYNNILNDIQVINSQLNDCVDRQEYNNILNDIQSVQNQLDNKVSQQQHESLITAVEQATTELAEIVNDKVSIPYFDAWSDNIDAQIANTISRQQFDNLYEAVETTTANLAVQIESKLEASAFEEWKLKSDVENRVTQAQFDNLYEAVETTTANLAVQIESKLDTGKFNDWVKNADLENKVSQQQFDNLYEAVETTTANLAVQIESKLDDGYFEEWKNGIEAEVAERVTRQSFDKFAENIYTKDDIEDRLSNYEYYVEQYFNSTEFKEYVDTFVTDTVTEYTEEYLETALDYYTKAEMDDKLSNLSLESYYSKDEIDAMIGNINTILNDVLYNY